MMGSNTMLSIMMTVVLVLVVEMVDSCERRGEQLVCLGELPTLDEKEVSIENLRAN